MAEGERKRGLSRGFGRATEKERVFPVSPVWVARFHIGGCGISACRVMQTFA